MADPDQVAGRAGAAFPEHDAAAGAAPEVGGSRGSGTSGGMASVGTAGDEAAVVAPRLQRAPQRQQSVESLDKRVRQRRMAALAA